MSLNLPEHKVDTDDTLGLGVLVVVDDGGLGLHPHEASPLGQHAVLACADLTLRKHWKERKKETSDLIDERVLPHQHYLLTREDTPVWLDFEHPYDCGGSW